MASVPVIGLDIGTTAVRAAAVEFGKGGPGGHGQPTLVALGQVPLPPGAVRDGEVAEPAIVSQALRALWHQAGFKSKDVVLGVGNQRIVVRDLQVPAMPMHQLRSALPYQVQELLPTGAADSLLDYYPTDEVAGPSGPMYSGMIVAAQRDTVVQNVLAVEGAGLRPTMVDLNAFALLRALARQELGQVIAAFVEIGARMTQVVVADHGVPKLVRVIPGGGQNITDAVAAAAQVSVQEAETLKRQIGVVSGPSQFDPAATEAVLTSARTLVEAVRNTFIFYASNHPGAGIEVAAVSGGGAHLPGLGQYLSSSTRVPVVLGDALAGFRFGRGIDQGSLVGAESLLALPIGLAYGVAA